MTLVETLLFASAVLFFAGTIKGFLGIGLPTVSMAFLTLTFDPRAAVSLILIPMMLSNFWQMLRGPDLRAVIARHWRFALLLGVTVGATVWISQSVGDRVLKFVLGVMVLAFSYFSWRQMVPAIPARLNRRVEFLSAGFAGIMGGLTAAWAGPLVIYLTACREARDDFVQSIGFLIAAGSLPLWLAYLATGHSGFQDTVISFGLLVPTLLGFGLGEALRKRTDPALFRAGLLILFAILGANLIRSGIWG